MISTFHQVMEKYTLQNSKTSEFYQLQRLKILKNAVFTTILALFHNLIPCPHFMLANEYMYGVQGPNWAPIYDYING